MSQREKDRPTFSFVSGRFHDPSCWDLVRRSLFKEGFSSIAPDFRIEDQEISLDEHAECLTKAEKEFGVNRYVRVGWSWGANVIMRSVEESTRKNILVAPGFHSSTVVNHPNNSWINTEHGLMYKIYQDLDAENREDFAHQLFYHDVENRATVQAAVESLREHPYREDEPVLDTFPAIPLGYIALKRDRVITLASQHETASALEVTAEELQSGHAPMYSSPEKLSRILIKLANKRVGHEKVLI